MALRAPERIEAPAVIPARGGLLNVATIVESGDRVMNGVIYFSYLCGKAGIAPGLCDVAPGVTFDVEKQFTGGHVVEGQPFPVYAGVICDLLGGGYEEQARGRLAGGEERAVGRAFYETLFSGGFPGGDQYAGPVTTEDELLAVVGELEQYAGENYAGLPILHMNRAMATRALKWGLISNDSVDGTLHTKQGIPVANSPGYPDGIVFITGAVHLWRTSVVAYDVNDIMNNQALSLAERVYTVATDCILAWAGVEPPEYQAPVLTALDPATVTVATATVVQVTGTGFFPSTKFYVGSTQVAAVVDPDGTSAMISVPAQASPGEVTITAVNSQAASNALPLAVNPAAPTLTSVTPNPAPRNLSWEYTLTGTGFTATGTTVSVNGQSPAVTYVSPTQVKVSTNLTAPVGQFTATTAAGTTAMVEVTTEGMPGFTAAGTTPATVPPEMATSVVIITSNPGLDIVARETDAAGTTIIGDLPITATSGSSVTVTIPARPADSTVYVRPYRLTLPTGAQTDPALVPKAIPVAPVEEP